MYIPLKAHLRKHNQHSILYTTSCCTCISFNYLCNELLQSAFFYKLQLKNNMLLASWLFCAIDNGFKKQIHKDLIKQCFFSLVYLLFYLNISASFTK